MADVTLTQDTLYSEIDSNLADDDTVYCDGYTLTIDQDVTKAIHFNPNNGGTIYCENTSTDTIRYINAAANYYFDSGTYDGHINMVGQLIKIGSVSSNITTVSLDSNLEKLHAVYIPSENMWFFDDSWYGGIDGSAGTNYVLSKQEKPLFTFDSSTGQINFQYKQLPDGTEIWLPNIIIHRKWLMRDTYNRLYFQNLYWDVKGVMFYGPSFYTSEIGKKYPKIDSSILLQGDTPYKKINNMQIYNSAIVGNSTYYGCIRADVTSNAYVKNCTLYPRWQWGDWCSNNVFEDCTFVTDYTNDGFSFATKNLTIKGGTFITGRASIYGGRYMVADGITFKASEDADYSPSYTYFPSFYSNGGFEIFWVKNSTFIGPIYNLINSSYVHGNYAIMTRCTMDISMGSSYKYWAYAVVGNYRFFNCNTIAADGEVSQLRTSSGSSFMPNHLIVGHRGDCSVSIDAPGGVVLDFRNGIENISNTYGNALMNAYDSNSSSWVYYLKEYGLQVDGELVVEMTLLCHNFIDDVGSWDSWEWYSTYNADLQLSYDGTDWYDFDTFKTLPIPTVINLWIKVIATNGTTIFNGVKLYYTRRDGWLEYPDVWRDQTIIVNQFYVSESMNTAFWHSRWDDIIDKKITENSVVEYTTWYDDSSYWQYKIIVRKYGYDFGNVLFNAEKEFQQTGYYLGQAKTGLTMTEEEASAITGITLQSSSDADYTWELDCGGKTLEDTYHYVQYKLTNFGEWAGVDTFKFNEFLIRDGDKFKTVWARDNEGVKLINYTGKVSSMTKDDGSIYVPPATVLFTFTVYPSITDYEWRLYQVDGFGSLNGAVELAGNEHEDNDTVTYSYVYDGTDKIAALQILPEPNNDYVESDTYYTLSNIDQTVTITLEKDENN